MLPAVDETHLRRATSFGSVADDYARARPGYPQAAVRWALERAPGTDVLDLAAGTGKLTGAMLDAGASVTAVEPLDGMRAQLEAAFPDVRALAGTAEAIPLDDRSVDAVMVGQAFHWFDVGPALDEIFRVLRPGGVLAPMWNVRDDSVPWIVAMTEAGRRGRRHAVDDGRRRLGAARRRRAVHHARAPRLPQPGAVRHRAAAGAGPLDQRAGDDGAGRARRPCSTGWRG